MANQKLWLRNYDNIFAAGYGSSNETASEVASPIENVPLGRRASDGHYIKLKTDSVSRQFTLATSTLGRITSYLTNASSNLYIASTTYSNITNILSPWAICLGSGTDPASYEDYDLKIPIRANMTLGTVTELTPTYDATTHQYTIGYKVPIAYSGANPIAINEFGLYVPIIETVGASYGIYGKPMMVYHEVFETPITLQQNDTIEITITQTVTQPNYTPYPSED